MPRWFKEEDQSAEHGQERFEGRTEERRDQDIAGLESVRSRRCRVTGVPEVRHAKDVTQRQSVGSCSLATDMVANSGQDDDTSKDGYRPLLLWRHRDLDRIHE